MSSMVSIGDGASPVSRNCSVNNFWNKVVKILSEVVLRILLFVIFMWVDNSYLIYERKLYFEIPSFIGSGGKKFQS